MGFFVLVMEVDITGKKYGDIIAISFSERRDGRIFWNFKCKCGKIFVARKYKVTSGTLKSCGCYGKRKRKEGLLNYYKKNNSIKISSEKVNEILINRFYKSYKKNAIKRNYSFNLSLEQFKDLVFDKCFYCKTDPNKKLKYNSSSKSLKYKDAFIFVNGIDRKNNKEGYSINNSVSCCSLCNYAKRDLKYDVFISWLNQIRKT